MEAPFRLPLRRAPRPDHHRRPGRVDRRDRRWGGRGAHLVAGRSCVDPGLAVAGSVWWAYFDVVSIVAERQLRRLRGEERARLARDAYSYLHLPMVAGIVLLALGIEQVLEYVGESAVHDLSDPLTLLPLGALYGGAALFLIAHSAFKYRTSRHVTVRRVLVALLLAGLIPLAAELAALAALGLLTAVLVVMIASEAVRYSELREQVRHEEVGSEADAGTEHAEPHPRGG
jgi:low temperature requirement protein LtrA